MLLVAQQNVIEQRAVTWEVGAGYLKGDRMPKLALLSSLVNFEISELGNFIFELDDEPDFCAGTEVTHD